jgi:DNA ligase (NAD+)
MEVINDLSEYNDKNFVKNINSYKVSELHRAKLYLDDLYYNTELCDFPDYRYDILKEILVKKDPKYIPPIGSKIRTNENRVKIPYFMGSADKITPNEEKELCRWFDKNPCKYVVISEKLDGVSGMFTCINGKKKLYTRGDGEVGADISYLIQYIKSIPKDLEDICVRGELIIKKNVFEEKYYVDGKNVNMKSTERLYKNARNMVSGLVGAKTIRKGLYDIEFVVYEKVGDKIMPKPSKQMRDLKRLGFTTAMFTKIKNPDNNMNVFVDLHNKFKAESEYEIDGIVVQSNEIYDRNISGNPSYSFAFKVCDENSIHETVVLDIEWSVSSWGSIVPVAIIDPIELPGNTIRRVTVSNAGLMKMKGIGPGSIIKVTRSKEVIPFIVSVTERCDKLKWPDMKYKWDENEVHIKVVDASPEIICEMRVKLFAKFFTKMGIKHVSRATIKKIYTSGFDTLLKIISADEKDLIKIDGIQKRSASRIVTNIREGLKGIKAPELMAACGVFGYGIGRKRVIALMTDVPDLLSRDRKDLKKRVLEVEGFSEIMADKVVYNIDYAVQFVDEISKYVSFVEDTRVSDTLVGLKYVFSGFRSKELEQQIEDRGGKIVTSVSKKTEAIIVSSKEDKSTVKVTKAESLGVHVYTKDEFIENFII